MTRVPDEKPTSPTTLGELIEATAYTPGGYKAPCCPPAIDPVLQLKWGLALLGKEKAAEYITWLQERLQKKPR